MISKSMTNLVRDAVKKICFLGLFPKLWVGGGQESLTFSEVSDLHVFIVFWVILSVIFPLKVLNVRSG